MNRFTVDLVIENESNKPEERLNHCTVYNESGIVINDLIELYRLLNSDNPKITIEQNGIERNINANRIKFFKINEN